MKQAHLNSLVLLHDETNSLWLKVNALIRQTTIDFSLEQSGNLLDALALVARAQFKLLDIIQSQKANPERTG